MTAFQAPTGTRDVLAPESARIEALVGGFAGLARRAAYGLIISPMFEDAGVFRRGVGEVSELVTKEMYEFEDRGGRLLALRPEGTASVVRAYVQHRPPLPFKSWYVTPAFRYERPQAGRYRQHHQLGVEAIGSADPDLDVEVVALLDDYLRGAGLSRLALRLNSMGDDNCRPAYVQRLEAFFAENAAALCGEHAEHWARNPLRVLDCKRPECMALRAEMPRLSAMRCEDCEAHFACVREGLDALGVGYELDDFLVRGLDYYTRTTFEFGSLALESAQNAVGGGGRYDKLVAALGGPETPGIGFATGIERVLLALDAEGRRRPTRALRSTSSSSISPAGGPRSARDLTDRPGAGLLRRARLRPAFAEGPATTGRPLRRLGGADRRRGGAGRPPGDGAGAARRRQPPPGAPRGGRARGAAAHPAREGAGVSGAPRSPRPLGLRTHYCGALGEGDVGATVAICGWVAHRREHGEHLAFLDVRDHTGLVQCVIDTRLPVRSEYVVRVEGTLRKRPAGTENPDLATGLVELADCQLEILSEAQPPPFVIDGHSEPDESVRLRYRYLDLRTSRMQRNLRLRARIYRALREQMTAEDFLEIETPLLWTPTPEGAREFAIPSRLQHGSFYVLPQSPQIAKQLTMVGGLDRYYQIARCMRDEDLRADRQFEFSQLDLEASFVTEREVRDVVTRALYAAVEASLGERPAPPVEMTWDEAIDRFGSDKPDLRFTMELVELTSALAETEFQAFRGEAVSVRAIVLAGGAELGRARLDALIERAKALGAKGLVWMRAVAGAGGVDLESPIAKFLSDGERAEMVRRCGAAAGDLVLIVADERERASLILGQLRVELGRPPVTEGPLSFCWVIDFPLFEGRDEAGNLVAAHHPFTMPKPGDLEKLTSDPLAVRAQSYDLVLNGWELGSGSIRIHRPDIQSQIFTALGISDEEAASRFGFLLGAFAYGAPPHGGFAVGLDRFVALLAGEENIREVIAFPKTQSGSDLMTGAPRPLGARQLGELGLTVVAPPRGVAPTEPR